MPTARVYMGKLSWAMPHSYFSFCWFSWIHTASYMGSMIFHMPPLIPFVCIGIEANQQSTGASPALTPDSSSTNSLWPDSEGHQKGHQRLRTDKLLLRGRSQNQLSVTPQPKPTYSGGGSCVSGRIVQVSITLLFFISFALPSWPVC